MQGGRTRAKTGQEGKERIDVSVPDRADRQNMKTQTESLPATKTSNQQNLLLHLIKRSLKRNNPSQQ